MQPKNRHITDTVALDKIFEEFQERKLKEAESYRKIDPVDESLITDRLSKLNDLYGQLLEVHPGFDNFNIFEITRVQNNDTDELKIHLNGSNKPGILSHMQKVIPTHDISDEIKRLSERIRKINIE